MAERSFWGWGDAERFPDRTTRDGMVGMVSALLGGVALEVRDPPRAEDIALSPARPTVPASLAHLVTSQPRERLAHTYGKAYRDVARGFAGDFAVAPDAVARPTSDDEVAALLDACGDAGVAVIPFGGGTSVVGGVEAAVGDGFAATLSMDLGAMTGVREVDVLSRAARIAGGTTGPAVEAALATHGMTLRHFPQSFEFSTVGGWLATRAGGHFATLYTHIDDLVESIRMVTPTGVWQSRRLPGSGAGPSPDRLALGSEGILGVITEAWLRVRPRPQFRAGASARFADFAQAVAATRAIAQADLFPANCRLLDAREAALHQVTGDGSHVLLLGFESADHPLGPWLDRAIELARSHGGTVGDARHSDEGAATGQLAGSWRAAFVDAPYLMNVLVSLGCIVDTFETACTWDRFDDLHRAVIAAARRAMKEVCGKGLITCRFTHVYPDGPAPYYTFIAPGRAGSELGQWAEIKAAVSDALLAAGGTISHHHAVGRMHRPWYDRQRPEPFARALAASKRALDPAGVLNPGVLIDPS